VAVIETVSVPDPGGIVKVFETSVVPLTVTVSVAVPPPDGMSLYKNVTDVQLMVIVTVLALAAVAKTTDTSRGHHDRESCQRFPALRALLSRARWPPSTTPPGWSSPR
jgi:hypothetical protein